MAGKGKKKKLPLRKRLKKALRCFGGQKSTEIGQGNAKGSPYRPALDTPKASTSRQASPIARGSPLRLGSPMFDEFEDTFTEAERKRMPDVRTKKLEDSFELGSPLGKGGYAVVNKIRHMNDDQWAASKLVTKVEKDSHVTNIEREIEILQLLKHENIVKFLSCFRMKGKRVYINTELCATDLFDFIMLFNRRMEIMYIKHILQSILRGVDHMHSNHVVHRDLKPANILITEGGVIKITDFGLSTFFEDPVPGRKRRMSLQGTLEYCAPEILQKNQDYGWEVDMWSVGCIAHALYFLQDLIWKTEIPDILTNIHEYCEPGPDGVADVIRRVLHEPGADEDDCTLFHYLLRIDPDDRPPAFEVLEIEYFHRGTAPASPEELSHLLKAKMKKKST